MGLSWSEAEILTPAIQITFTQKHKLLDMRATILFFKTTATNIMDSMFVTLSTLAITILKGLKLIRFGL